MATQLTTRDDDALPTPATLGQAVAQFRGQLDQQAHDFKAALPAHITLEKFQRTIVTAVQTDPDLLKADRRSLILACMKAAQDGLLPDKREAALVLFKENKKDAQGKWQTKMVVVYMPMVYGLRKKILQSGEIAAIGVNVVYRREFDEGFFHYEDGTESTLRHKPMLDLTSEDARDENIIAAYSIATFKDGSKDFKVLRRFQIDKVRECSQTGATRTRKGEPRTPSGPWVDWFPEQAMKTALRSHSKTLPMSGDLIDVEASDDALYARSAATMLAVQPDAPRLVPPTPEEIAADDPPHDPVTGEITEDAARAADAEGFADMEGRTPKEQRGEGTTLESAKAEIDAAELVPDVNSRVIALAPLLNDDDAETLRQHAMDRIAALKGDK